MMDLCNYSECTSRTSWLLVKVVLRALKLISVCRPQLSDFAIEEFNGFPGKSAFNASPKLSQRIAAQLVKPFMFTYTNGHVGDIRASAEISDTVVNIVRGILSLFQVTLKTTQRIYELEEVNRCWCASSFTA